MRLQGINLALCGLRLVGRSFLVRIGTYLSYKFRRNTRICVVHGALQCIHCGYSIPNGKYFSFLLSRRYCHNIILKEPKHSDTQIVKGYRHYSRVLHQMEDLGECCKVPVRKLCKHVNKPFDKYLGLKLFPRIERHR